MGIEQIFPTKKKKIKVTILDLGVRLGALSIFSFFLLPFEWSLLIPLFFVAFGVFCVAIPIFLELFVDSLIETDYGERVAILIFERFLGYVLWTIDRSSSECQQSEVKEP